MSRKLVVTALFIGVGLMTAMAQGGWNSGRRPSSWSRYGYGYGSGYRAGYAPVYDGYNRTQSCCFPRSGGYGRTGYRGGSHCCDHCGCNNCHCGSEYPGGRGTWDGSVQPGFRTSPPADQYLPHSVPAPVPVPELGYYGVRGSTGSRSRFNPYFE